MEPRDLFGGQQRLWRGTACCYDPTKESFLAGGAACLGHSLGCPLRDPVKDDLVAPKPQLSVPSTPHIRGQVAWAQLDADDRSIICPLDPEVVDGPSAQKRVIDGQQSVCQSS